MFITGKYNNTKDGNERQ
jgi:hypothetical protein